MNNSLLPKKAYTVLCIAGLNPSDYNLNKFNNSLAVWLVRAYIAIFHVVPNGLIVAPVSVRDDETNCQVIINELNRQRFLAAEDDESVPITMQLVDALYRKYMLDTAELRNDSMMGGDNIDLDLDLAPPKTTQGQGRHRALKKSVQKSRAKTGTSPLGKAEGAPAVAEPRHNSDRELLQRIETLEDRLDGASVHSDTGSRGGKMSKKKKKKRRPRFKSDVSTITGPASPREGENDGPSQTEHALGIVQDDGDGAGASDLSPSDGEGRRRDRVGKGRRSRPSSAPSTRLYSTSNRPRSASNRAAAMREARESQWVGGRWNVKMHVPAEPVVYVPSAPPADDIHPRCMSPNDRANTGSRIKATIDAHIRSSRDMTPAEMEDEVRAKDRAAARSRRRTLEDEAGEPQAPTYTYDIQTGRRKLYVEDDIWGVHKAQKEETPVRPPSPTHTRPDWPGMRTKTSTLEWVRRKKSEVEAARAAERAATQVRVHTLPLYRALFHPGYMYMEKLDVLVSVEHCVNCEHHNTTLRHDADEYAKRANEALAACAQIIFDMQLNVRLGVFRFHADVTANSKATDDFTRIGALEIHIAVKDASGDIVNELLHSKLCTRSWPSKMALKKRIPNFINTRLPSELKRRIFPTAAGNGSGEEGEFVSYNNDPVAFGLHPYPAKAAGFFPEARWATTPVAEKQWGYQPGGGISLGGIGYPDAEEDLDEDACDRAHAGLPYVQWVYDARGDPSAPLPPPKAAAEPTREPISEPEPEPEPESLVADTIIHLLGHSWPCVLESGGEQVKVTVKERWPMPAVVRAVPQPGDIDGEVAVVLKYSGEEEFTVSLSRIDSAAPEYHQLWQPAASTPSEGEAAALNPTLSLPPAVPIELFTLLYYARMVQGNTDLWCWGEDPPAGAPVKRLPLSEFYSRLRTLAVHIEEAHRKGNSDGGVPAHLVFCPKTGEWIDLQLAYSDAALRWIQESSRLCKGTGVDVMALQNRAVMFLVSANFPQGDGPAGDQTELEAHVPVTAEAVEKTLTMAAFQDVKVENSGGTATPGGAGAVPAVLGADLEDTAIEGIADTKLMEVTHNVVQTVRQTIIDVAKRIRQYRSPSKEGRRKSSPRAGADDVLDTDALIKVFRQLDSSNTGELDIKDFVKALSLMGVVCTEQVLEALSASFDADGNGRISLEEFIDFVSYSPEKGRELGELWSIVRSGVQSIESEIAGDQTTCPSVSQLHDLFTIKMLDQEEHPGHYVSGVDFMEIVNSLCDPHLEQADKRLLLRTFGEPLNPPELEGPQSPKGADTAAVAAEEAAPEANVEVTAEVDLTSHRVRFVDFLCWIQPVDVTKVVRRVGRFIKAAIGREKGMEEVQGAVADIKALITESEEVLLTPRGGNHRPNFLIDPLTEKVSLRRFHNCIDELGLPVSSAEVRALVRHVDPAMDMGVGHYGTGAFSLTEFRAIMSGQLPPPRAKVGAVVDSAADASTAIADTISNTNDVVPNPGADHVEGNNDPLAPDASAPLSPTSALVVANMVSTVSNNDSKDNATDAAPSAPAEVAPVSAPSSPPAGAHRLQRAASKLSEDLTPDPPRPEDDAFVPLQLQINRVELACGVFKQSPAFDKVRVSVNAIDASHTSNTSGSVEKGLVLRTFDVEDAWTSITVSADDFKEKLFTLEVFNIQNTNSDNDFKEFRTKVSVPMYVFMTAAGKITTLSKVVLLPVEFHEVAGRRSSFRSAYINTQALTAAPSLGEGGDRRRSVREPPPPTNYLRAKITYVVRDQGARTSKLDTSALAKLKLPSFSMMDEDFDLDSDSGDESLKAGRKRRSRKPSLGALEESNDSSNMNSVVGSTTNLSDLL
mgnify:FL=1